MKCVLCYLVEWAVIVMRGSWMMFLRGFVCKYVRMPLMRGMMILCVAMSFALSMLCGSPAAQAVDVLRVGVDYMTNRNVGTDGANVYRGPDTDYMNLLAGYAGMECTFVGGTRAELYQMLDEGKVDVVSGIVWTDDLAKKYDFSEIPSGKSNRLLFLHDGFDGLFEGTKHVRLGMLRNYFMYDGLDEFMSGEGFTYTPIVYETGMELSRAYERNEIDGFICTNRLNVDYAPSRRFAPRMLYYIVNKSNRPLFDRLNIAQEQLTMLQPHLIQSLYDKYEAQHARKGIMLTKSEMEYLRDKEKLRIAVSKTGKPFAYEENGEVKGIVMHYVESIEKDLGVDVEVVPIEKNKEGWEMLRSGEIDLILNQFLDYDLAHEHHFLVTAPYRDVAYCAVARNGATIPDKPTVAALMNSINTQKFEEKRFAPEQIKYYKTSEECMRAVQRGEADITYRQTIMAQYNIWQGDFPDLMMVTARSYTHETSMAVNEGNAVLLTILDKEIGRYNSDETDDYVMKESQNIGNSRSLIALVYLYPFRFLIGALIFIVVVIGFFVNAIVVRRRHEENVRHMLYTDRYTGYHNRIWLENEGKKIVDALPENERVNVGVVTLTMADRTNFVSMYGNSQLEGIIHDVATMLKGLPWVIAFATASRAGHVYILTKPMDIEVIKENIYELFKKEEYFDVGAIKGRIYFRAGISMLGFNLGALPIAITHSTAAANLKRKTHDNIVVYDENMHEQVIFEQLVTEMMDDALAKDEFEVWLQPKYDIKTRHCVGAEALVRWNSPDLGFLMPGRFIGIFEKNGFVTKLDFYMLEKTYKYQQARHDAGLPVVPISVNQSRLHMQEQDDIKEMRRVHDRYTVSDAIELEITESAFDFGSSAQRDASIKIVGELKDMGFGISMDDFGTGYSDIALLNVLPFDVMKIDRSILIAPGDRERKMNLIKQVVQMGHGFGMHVICEGIETTEQEELLTECGCEYGQGYYYGKPMPMDDFTKFLETHL